LKGLMTKDQRGLFRISLGLNVLILLIIIYLVLI